MYSGYGSQTRDTFFRYEITYSLNCAGPFYQYVTIIPPVTMLQLVPSKTYTVSVTFWSRHVLLDSFGFISRNYWSSDARSTLTPHCTGFHLWKFISNLPIRDHLHGWLYKLIYRWLCYWCPYFLIQPVTGLRCSLRMTQTILPVVLFSPAFSRFPRVKSRFWTKNCASPLV